jgi:hypothetical protein
MRGLRAGVIVAVSLLVAAPATVAARQGPKGLSNPLGSSRAPVAKPDFSRPALQKAPQGPLPKGIKTRPKKR